MSAPQAYLIAEWGPTTLYLDGAVLDVVDAEPSHLAQLVGDGLALSAV